jgi:hypothetical protein
VPRHARFRQTRPSLVGFSDAVCQVVCQEIQVTRHALAKWNQGLNYQMSGLSGCYSSREALGNQCSQIRRRGLKLSERSPSYARAACEVRFGLQLDSKRAIATTLKGVNVWSGCRDLNPGPPAPQAGALARLRHSPNSLFYRTWPPRPYFVCYT